MNKLKKIVAKAMNKRASEWKLGKLIAEDIEQEKKLQGSIPITNYAVYWNIQVFNDMKELDVPQLSKKAQDAIFDDIKVALQGGFSKGEIQLQKEDLEEEDIKILNKDLLLEFFLNFEEKDLSLDDVEIDLGNTYDGLPESYVKFRQLANKKNQISKMAKIVRKEMLKSAKVSKKANHLLEYIGNLLSEGYASGADPVWDINITINNDSELFDELSYAAQDYIRNEISYPVKDGHLDYSDVEIWLSGDRAKEDFTEKDLMKIFTDEETVKTLLSDPKAEERFYVSYDLEVDEDELENNEL